MTAETFDDDHKRFAETGMDDLITKPLEPAALDKILERWLPVPR